MSNDSILNARWDIDGHYTSEGFHVSRAALQWDDSEGNRYHVWTNSIGEAWPADKAPDFTLYKNPARSIAYMAPGYFQTKHLDGTKEVNQRRFYVARSLAGSLSEAITSAAKARLDSDRAAKAEATRSWRARILGDIQDGLTAGVITRDDLATILDLQKAQA